MTEHTYISSSSMYQPSRTESMGIVILTPVLYKDSHKFLLHLFVYFLSSLQLSYSNSVRCKKSQCITDLALNKVN